MKKLLLVGALLGASALSFADAKSDYQNAENLAKDKKVEQAVKVLEKVVNSGDATYVTKANFQLGAYYLGKNNIPTAKKYLLSAWNDGKTVTEDTVEAARLLYLISLQEKNIKGAENYISWADEKTQGADGDLASSLIIFYFENGMQSKGQARYNKAMSSSNVDYKAYINYNVGQYYLGKNNLPNATKYLKDSYSSASKEAKLPAGYLLAQIALAEKNNADAEKYLTEMNTITSGKNAQILGMLGSHYLQTNNLTKAEDYLKKAAAADPKSNDANILLLAIYESKNDTANATSIYNKLKAKAPTTVNKELGIFYAGLGSPQLAEKYLQKAITENKDNQAKAMLGQLYAQMGKKAEAVKLLKEAVAAKVQGADQILKQVEAMK